LDICRASGAQWVPDPTMLLSADDYHLLYKDEQTPAPGMNCRLHSLFEIFGTGERFADGSLDMLDAPIDWEAAEASFKRFLERANFFNEFLREARART
jgi:hypothetical protein